MDIQFTTNANGSIKTATLLKSTGNAALDALIMKKARAASFYQYKVNGQATPFTVNQDFTLIVK